MKRYSKRWFKFAFGRAFRTTIQCFAAMYAMSTIVGGIGIYFMLLTSTLAGFYSLITCGIFGMPETHTDGTFHIDQHNEDKNIYRLDFDTDPNILYKRDIVVLNINSNSDLSQK